MTDPKGSRRPIIAPPSGEQTVLPGMRAVGAAKHPAPVSAEPLPLEDKPHAENEFFLPVHGFVSLTAQELAVINHSAFQRLGTINQLGHSHLVFRGATHRRMEHVIGTLHVAQEMCDAIFRNHGRARRAAVGSSRIDTLPLGREITPEEEAFIRLGALLHDIGHLPAGHTLEDELALLPKHDSVARFDLVLGRTDWPGRDSSTLGDVVNAEYKKFLPEGAGYSAVDVFQQIVAKDPAEELHSEIGKFVRIGVCRDIIGNTICADLLDYLHRDWYHIGKPRYFDKRLFQYMEIRTKDGEDQFVISLGRSPKLRTDAVTAILGLLESRYELAETVLYHRTKCAAAAMLERAIFEIESAIDEKVTTGWRDSLQNRLLDESDDSMISWLLSEARTRKVEAAIRPLEALAGRRLYTAALTSFSRQFDAALSSRLQEIYTAGEKRTGSAEKRAGAARRAATSRNEAVRLLESDFNLPPGSVALYCPDKAMNAKIAEVKVHFDDQIRTLSEWDSAAPRLCGGHLQAQLVRFADLWRLHVVIDRTAWSNLGPEIQAALRDAIRIAVMLKFEPEHTPATAMRQIARIVASTPGTRFDKRTATNEPRIAAIGRVDVVAFPTGAPSLSAFFDDDNEVPT